MITCKFENGGDASLRHVTCDCILRLDDQILLVKRANDVPVQPGKWAIPGGFMDRDEDIFECVRREILEETGYTISHPDLLLIVHLPKRLNEDRQNIDFIFTADVRKKVGESDHEIDEVHWFDISDLPDSDEIAFDHSLILERYAKHLKQPSALPILDFKY